MDPVVDFYNIDRSDWHTLIGLIDDTHTIISYLFIEIVCYFDLVFVSLLLSQKNFLKQKE